MTLLLILLFSIKTLGLLSQAIYPIVSSALKFFHLIRRQIASNHSVSLKLSLYITLIRSKLTYCSQIRRPRLVKDIKFIESVQRKGSKFILNDFSSNYKDRLIQCSIRFAATYVLV